MQESKDTSIEVEVGTMKPGDCFRYTSSSGVSMLLQMSYDQRKAHPREVWAADLYNGGTYHIHKTRKVIHLPNARVIP